MESALSCSRLFKERHATAYKSTPLALLIGLTIHIYIYMHGSPEVSSSKVLDPVDTEEEWRKCDSSGGFPSAGYLVPKELRSRRDSITTLAIVG